MRSRIVLAADDGGSNTELSQRLGLAIGTIQRWRNRFAEMRCDRLLEEPRPGRPRVVGDERINTLITATLETTPSPRRSRRAPGPGQRLHPQDTVGETMADRPSPLRRALHPDRLILAEPGGTLVRRTDHQETAPPHPHLGAPTQQRHPCLIDTWNDNPRPYVWTKTADQILASIGNYCTRIDDSPH